MLKDINILDATLEYLEDKVLILNNSIIYEKDICKIYDIKKEVAELESQTSGIEDFITEYEDIQEHLNKEQENQLIFSYRISIDNEHKEHFIKLHAVYSDHTKYSLVEILKKEIPEVNNLLQTFKNKDVIVFQFEDAEIEVDLLVAEYKKIFKDQLQD